MKKIDYLRSVLKAGTYRRANWFFSAFAITRENEGKWKNEPYETRIVQEPWGIGFVTTNGNGESSVVKIEDAKAGQPLFKMTDPLVVDESWGANIKGTIETNVGSLLVNYLLLIDNFAGKIPYIPYRVEMSKIESFIINNRAVDIEGKERDPTKIYLDEYIKMGQAVEFIRTLPTLSTSSLTKKNMTRPPGLDAHKKKVLKEKYNNDLSDPVDLANFESEMGKFADEYRKGDPSEGKLVKGKIRNNSIRKMVISSGAEGGMGTPMVPIVESLSEGLTYSPKQLQALINGSRSGSYFRGLDTVKGGVSFKLAVRVLSAFFIGEEDCGSTLGLQVKYDKTNIKQLVSRAIVGQEKARIENIDAASNYLGKTLSLRSPGWCKSKSSVICRTCAGPRLSKFPEGLAIPGSDVSSIILAASMAAMHKNTTEVTVLDLSEVIS